MNLATPPTRLALISKTQSASRPETRPAPSLSDGARMIPHSSRDLPFCDEYRATAPRYAPALIATIHQGDRSLMHKARSNSFPVPVPPLITLRSRPPRPCAPAAQLARLLVGVTKTRCFSSLPLLRSASILDEHMASVLAFLLLRLAITDPSRIEARPLFLRRDNLTSLLILIAATPRLADRPHLALQRPLSVSPSHNAKAFQRVPNSSSPRQNDCHAFFSSVRTS